MKLKNEKYGDFTILFDEKSNNVIEAIAVYKGLQKAGEYGKTKKIAFNRIKILLDKRFPLQVPNSSDYFLGPDPRKHKNYNFYRGKK